MKGLVFVIAIFILCPVVYGQTEEIARVRERLKALKIAELKADIAKLKADIAEAKGISPQNPAKEVAPVAPKLVNILLVDNQGHVPHCYKGVRVDTITQNGKNTQFLFDSKPISWNQKVVFSYLYTPNDVPIAGKICYTKDNREIEVISALPCNVYQDDDGTIRYDDLNGRYPLAPNGSGYVTNQ